MFIAGYQHGTGTLHRVLSIRWTQDSYPSMPQQGLKYKTKQRFSHHSCGCHGTGYDQCTTMAADYRLGQANAWMWTSRCDVSLYLVV